ncbi:MAG TPA: ABC transporter ATP-binding protein [Opitutaceae bacterium]|nr:ABC transporter ATP-binding protein [Opitutaceae bacterium]
MSDLFKPDEAAGIRLKQASLSFGEGANRLEALHQLELTIPAGEFVSVLGPSGCGKSTLIGAIAGLAKLSAGELLVNGSAVRAPGAERGVVFQHHTLFPWKTVFQNVEFGLRNRGVKKPERTASVREMLAHVGLEEFTHHYPAQLSGGMQQRVNLARALVNRPKVLLMDEPFAALDAQTRLNMQELLLALWSERRMTVLFVTHDVDEALFLADRVVVLSRRPAEIRSEVVVELPRPRTTSVLTEPRFSSLKRHCLELLRNESRRSIRPPPGDAQASPEELVEAVTEQA